MTAKTLRVVVTGVGLASALGVGRDVLRGGLEHGASCLLELDERLARVPPGAGGVLDLPRKEFRNYFDTRILRLSTMTRQTMLSCIAAGDLLADAGCPPNGTEYTDRGAYLGSFIVPPDFAKQVKAVRILAHRPDGEDTGYVLDDARLDEAMKMASAFDFLRALPNMPSAHLSIQAGYQGPTCTYLGSDSSGLQAMGMAVGAIQSGLATAMIAGGAFFPFQEVHLAWQEARGLWADAGPVGERVRPYAEGRTGTLPGEGAALVYFEEREAALARGATILAEVIGFGQRFITPGGSEELEVRADTLKAALPEGAPDWIGALGLGHPEIDALEAQAYTQAFGDSLSQSGLVTLVPQIGYCGPAAGPLNLVAALLAASGQVAPRRFNVSSDEDCSVLAEAMGRSGRTGAGSVVLGSSFSLDGVHAALALRVGG